MALMQQVLTQQGRNDNSISMSEQETQLARVIHMHDYLNARVQSVRDEIKELERVTGILMNQLIREKDQGIARRLQREIGRLDSQHSQLNEVLQAEEQRQDRYANS